MVISSSSSENVFIKTVMSSWTKPDLIHQVRIRLDHFGLDCDRLRTSSPTCLHAYRSKGAMKEKILKMEKCGQQAETAETAVT